MRPKLDKSVHPNRFLEHYWLKAELIAFCKEWGIPRNDGKQEITKRIHHYLLTGDVLQPGRKHALSKSKPGIELSLESKIPEDYTNDEVHRAFFKKMVGDHFKFNVLFMNWMKVNSGKTYREAIDIWQAIHKAKLSGKTHEIGPQFEYNQYSRDFFASNPDKSRQEMVACWNFKKSISGKVIYDLGDLIALSDIQSSPAN